MVHLPDKVFIDEFKGRQSVLNFKWACLLFPSTPTEYCFIEHSIPKYYLFNYLY